MDYKNIQELIKTVSDSNLTNFEIESDGISIKMERKEQQTVVERIAENNVSAESTIKRTATTENIAENQISGEKLQKNISSAIENTTNTIQEENIVIVKSPIVGAMYSSPSEESQNFVKVGSKVKKGDTLCILEAMKLMNEIESEVDGEIIEILVSNEEMVEFGQPLFKIRKQ